MSLDAWEERALGSIADGLSASAPELASRLSVFNQLTCGERMPEYPWVKAEGRRSHGRARGSGAPAWPVVMVISVVAAVTTTAIVLALTVHGPGDAPGGNPPAARCTVGYIPCSGR